MSDTWSRVVVDVARHPLLDFAVIWNDELLPIRFSTFVEAANHLHGLKTGEVIVNPKFPRTIEPGKSLATPADGMA